MRLVHSMLPATIEVRINLPQADVLVHADPSQIHQVMLNLCTNAFQALGERGGLLEITASEVEPPITVMGSRNPRANTPHILLSVRDTGPGIEPEIRARIFEPFFTTKDVGAGTGLGLSVAHGIITSHDGYLTVDSILGVDTTFLRFSFLPCRLNPRQRTWALPHGARSVHHGSGRGIP